MARAEFVRAETKVGGEERGKIPNTAVPGAVSVRMGAGKMLQFS